MSARKSIYHGSLEVALIETIAIEIIAGQTSLVTATYKDEEGTVIVSSTVLIESGEHGFSEDLLESGVASATTALKARTAELGLSVEEASA